jgi:hypothetical protein
LGLRKERNRKEVQEIIIIIIMGREERRVRICGWDVPLLLA